MPDIDIDFVDRTAILDKIDYIAASRKENGQLLRHNTGVYLHEIPFDCIGNLAAVPYEEAENFGYFKIDFLNASIYKGIKNENHLLELMNHEPLWDLLEQDEFIQMLFHVNGHGDILRKMKPKSIEQLAAVLAIIRPAKRHLIGQDWSKVMSEVWEKPTNGEYFFKKSHATAYAAAIVVQMNLICENLSYGFS